MSGLLAPLWNQSCSLDGVHGRIWLPGLELMQPDVGVDSLHHTFCFLLTGITRQLAFGGHRDDTELNKRKFSHLPEHYVCYYESEILFGALTIIDSLNIFPTIF